MHGDPIRKWRERYARCCINVDSLEDAICLGQTNAIATLRRRANAIRILASCAPPTCKYHR
jgi:hypothetical protein